MITLPFEAAVAWGAGAIGLGTLLWWLTEEYRQGTPQNAPGARAFWRCHICASIYTTGAGERLTICSACGSYNSQEGTAHP